MADRLHVTSRRQLQPLLPRHPSLPHTLKRSNITSNITNCNPPKGNLNRKENLCLLYASYRQIDEELSCFFNHFWRCGHTWYTESFTRGIIWLRSRILITIQITWIRTQKMALCRIRWWPWRRILDRLYIFQSGHYLSAPLSKEWTEKKAPL